MRVAVKPRSREAVRAAQGLTAIHMTEARLTVPSAEALPAKTSTWAGSVAHPDRYTSSNTHNSPRGTKMNDGSQERLAALRQELRRNGLDGFIIPRADEHLSEYVPASAERLAWLTGFTGSAGMAVVLPDRAAAFTDGRYVLQLAAQTDADLWERKHIIEEPPPSWLSVNAAAGAKIGYDPLLISEEGLARYIDAGLDVVAVDRNPIDAVWTDRPTPSLAPAVPHPLEHAGRSAEEKREQVAALLREAKQDAAVISDPASIAWLLNIRGSDVPFTPFALGFALVHANGGTELFMDPGKLPEATRAWLGNSVSVAGREALAPALRRFGASGSAWIPRAPQSGSHRRCATRGLSWWPVPIRACCRRHARTKSSSGVPAMLISGMPWRSAGSCTFLPRTVSTAARQKCRRRPGCWRCGIRLRASVARVFPQSRARASTARSSTTASQRTATGQSGRTRFT